jgi:SPX domain protein involved in polyphosphate accumulation
MAGRFVLLELSLSYALAAETPQASLASCAPLQGVVRTTHKYWVRMSDVSTVKHHILQARWVPASVV